ncbi:hypothetical protein WN55_03324 [Dufourea novaeangliae]|uniref:Uncharacterized protein n=1 Tax=Dufourea novaeangliae TaxID=178035 RepID=A0A154PL19_DUFNO|nr:hypothetical protein WN55_03324 [Dufourea novaeangliae]
MGKPEDGVGRGLFAPYDGHEDLEKTSLYYHPLLSSVVSSRRHALRHLSDVNEKIFVEKGGSICSLVLPSTECYRIGIY